MALLRELTDLLKAELHLKRLAAERLTLCAGWVLGLGLASLLFAVAAASYALAVVLGFGWLPTLSVTALACTAAAIAVSRRMAAYGTLLTAPMSLTNAIRHPQADPGPLPGPGSVAAHAPVPAGGAVGTALREIELRSHLLTLRRMQIDAALRDTVASVRSTLTSPAGLALLAVSGAALAAGTGDEPDRDSGEVSREVLNEEVLAALEEVCSDSQRGQWTNRTLGLATSIASSVIAGRVLDSLRAPGADVHPEVPAGVPDLSTADLPPSATD